APLEQIRVANDRHLDELYRRLDDYLLRVAQRAELIHPGLAEVQRTIEVVPGAELEEKRSDALILACVLSHSSNSQVPKRALLTGDEEDFSKDQVRVLLDQAGVKLFRSTEKVLGWARAST